MPSQIVRVPLKGYAYSNIDGVELSKQPEDLIDGYVNESGTYVKRPGLREFIDTAQGVAVRGMYYWEEKNLTIVVSNQNVYTVTEEGVVTDVTNDQLSGNNRPTFAEVTDSTGAHHLVIADGGDIIRWTGTGTTDNLTGIDANAPTPCTHVVFFGGYLFGNNGDNTVKFSDLNDYENFSSGDSGIVSAESNNDNVDAIFVSRDEIAMFGQRSIEYWYTTGEVDVITRNLTSTTESGCIAPHSIQNLDGRYFYIDNNRRVVTIDPGGRATRIISSSIDKVLSQFETVDDAVGDILQVNGRGFYVLSFPSEDRTLVYDYQSNGWTEWAYWDLITAAYERFRGNCVLYVPQWNKHLVGDRSNGKVYTMDENYYEDDGDVIRMLLRTGHINYGINRRKRSDRLRVKGKRGVAVEETYVLHNASYYKCIKSHKASSTNEPGVGANWATYWSQEGEVGDAWVTGTYYIKGETDPKFSLRVKDDGGSWNNESYHPLGLVGQTEFYIDAYPRGIYRARQLEIVQTDSVEFRLISLEETIKGMVT